LESEISEAWVVKGAPDYQVKKANDSGCLQIASSLVVMSTKSVEEWRERVVTPFLLESEISEAWVVGDSIRSDINPGLYLGLNAVHVQSPDVWDFEEAQLGTLNNGQLFYTVDTIGDAPRCLK
jgi:putative hydrolase of the HAD superfamily